MPLLIDTRRVDRYKIHVEQELQVNLFRVVDNVYGLCEPCFVGARQEQPLYHPDACAGTESGVSR